MALVAERPAKPQPRQPLDQLRQLGRGLDAAHAGTVETDVDLDQDPDLSPGRIRRLEIRSAFPASSTATIGLPIVPSRASSATLRSPTTWLATKTSPIPASIIAVASQTVAVVSPIAPASICIWPRTGLLWIFACGRSAAGTVSIRRRISSMLARTFGRSRISAGVASSSRGEPMNPRAAARRSLIPRLRARGHGRR